jgi:hypothetical protein
MWLEWSLSCIKDLCQSRHFTTDCAKTRGLRDRISIVRGERDRCRLKLKKISNYTVYGNFRSRGYVYCIINFGVMSQCDDK